MAGQGPAPLPHIGLLLDAPAITGTVGKSLGALTSVAAGGVLVLGSTSQQLGQLTLLSEAGGGDGVAFLTKTLGTLTGAGAGTVTVGGTVAKTLGSITLATVGGPTVVGGLTKTLGGVVFSAGASVGVGLNQGGDAAPLPHLGLLFYQTAVIVGTVSKTLGTLTSLSEGYIPPDELPAYDFDDMPPLAVPYYRVVRNLEWVQADTVIREDTGGLAGILDSTLGALQRSASGTVSIDGTVAKTLEALTSVAPGVVTVSGSTAKTLGVLTCASAADVDSNFVCTMAQTLGVMTATGAGNVGIGCELAKTLGAMDLDSVGGISGGNYIAGVSKTLGALGIFARAGVDADATLSVTFGPLSGNLQATTYDGFVAVVNQTLGSLTSSSVGDVFEYELGVRRRWKAQRTERRIGSRKARAAEREIEGELVE